MIPPTVSRAISATAVAWLAAGSISSVARRPLLERLDVLTRPYATDPEAGDLVRAAIFLCRAVDVAGFDVAAAERGLTLAIFDFFFARSEEAVRAAGFDGRTMKALGLEPGNHKAA